MSIERATGRKPPRWPWVLAGLAWVVGIGGLTAACHVGGTAGYEGPMFVPSKDRPPLGFCVGKPVGSRWDYDIPTDTWNQVPITAPRVENGYSPRFCPIGHDEHLE